MALREYGLQPLRFGPRKIGPSGHCATSLRLSSTIAGVR
jgi:hypothetical protein